MRRPGRAVLIAVVLLFATIAGTGLLIRRTIPHDPSGDVQAFLAEYQEVANIEGFGSFHRRAFLVDEAARLRRMLPARHGWRTEIQRSKNGRWDVMATAYVPGPGGPWLRRFAPIRERLGPQAIYTIRLYPARYVPTVAGILSEKPLAEGWTAAMLEADARYPFHTPPSGGDRYLRSTVAEPR